MIKGIDHIEPQLADIPGVRRQPNDAIRKAYWYGVRLHNYGWLLRSIECSAEGSASVAEVVLETPSHRVITCRADSCTNIAEELPDMFALAVRFVAISTGERGMRELRTRLRSQLFEHRRLTLAHASLHFSPLQLARQAAYELIDEHRWILSGFGTAMAQGGFIADIPEDTIAVYPAGMAGDGTPAGALAHAIGNLAADQLAVLTEQINAYQQQVQQIRDNQEQGKAA
ncbi:Uncharacterised protein [Mycobacteroides abscessus subsp. abscessus]|uniref:hypothetical protein n=1 Tax=Mycobacteroides abscessus TaxID=36809 RepID=UPI0009282C94|nr:hypothetical protein [Mycobacteroides abscessus]SHU29303.1 Uncharacterised protein [Mycobacteroides abscessus subsp. abscessus]